MGPMVRKKRIPREARVGVGPPGLPAASADLPHQGLVGLRLLEAVGLRLLEAVMGPTVRKKQNPGGARVGVVPTGIPGAQAAGAGALGLL